MAFRTQKISQMTPKGANLEATDLIEVSTIESGSYVTRSITGQEIIDAIPVPPSGITIGSTAIASGSVGRILFEGAGNVVQESGNLFWDNTNRRLGIGTSSPANTLDVVGGQLIKATADGFESIKLQNFANTYFNTISFYKSNGTTQTVVLGDNGASVSYPFLTGMRADYGFVGNKNSGFHIFAGTNIAQTMHTTGNIGVNTTTDAGFRLDVNGTARVTEQFDCGSGGASLNGIKIIPSTNTRLEFWQAIRRISVYRNNGDFLVIDGVSAHAMSIRPTGVIIGGTSSSNLSSTAQLQIDSTTKGFLPPRMTTTQKNAIASPAAGLMVYDTTLNVISYYNGTMWI